MRVLVDLRVGFFFLTGLSTLSSGRGKTMGGPKLRVRSRGKGAVMGMLGEVVVFLWYLIASLVVVWGMVRTVLLNRKIGSSSSMYSQIIVKERFLNNILNNHTNRLPS